MLSMKKSLLNDSDRKMLNQAVEHELYASNFYKYGASCTQKQGYFGAQKFFEKEAADETEHYYMIRDFMNDLGDEAEMPTINKVEFEGETLSNIFLDAYELEIDLGDFYKKAYTKTDDPFVKTFLHKMVNIQRKAVGEYGDLIARLKLCKDNTSAILLFDQELGNK
jgi:ferritin